MFRKKKGQSTLEYITLFAAIVAAVVVLAYVILNPAVKNVMDSSAAKIKTATDVFKQ